MSRAAKIAELNRRREEEQRRYEEDLAALLAEEEDAKHDDEEDDESKEARLDELNQVKFLRHEPHYAGKGFPSDYFDLIGLYSTDEQVRDSVRYLIERTVKHHNLRDDSGIRVVLTNTVTGFDDAISSKKLPVYKIREWVENKMIDSLHTYDYGALPDRVEITWITPDMPGRGGTEATIKSTKKTHAFNTGLCCQIAIALDEACYEYKLNKERGESLHPECTNNMKNLKKVMKNDSKFMQSIKEWECMSNDAKSAIQDSKSSNLRMEKAEYLSHKAGIFGKGGCTDKDAVKIVNQISIERKELWGLQIFNKNGALLCNSIQEDTVEKQNEKEKHVVHWVYLMKTLYPAHYRMITSVAGFVNKKGLVYCPFCKQLKATKHDCIGKCRYCDDKKDHVLETKEKVEKVPKMYYKCTLCFKVLLSELIDCVECKQKNNGDTYMEWYKKKHPYIECDDCHLLFAGKECYDCHKEVHVKKSGLTWTRCDKIWKCVLCNKVFGRSYKTPSCKREYHDCNNIYCANCKVWDVKWPDHKCYIKTQAPKPVIGTYTFKDGRTIEKILYSDFEAIQDEIVFHGTKQKEIKNHEVNLVCTQESDGTKWPSFDNISDWFDYLAQDCYSGFTLVFHNASGYDTQFVAKEAVRRKVQFIPQFSQGTRIRSFLLKGLKKNNVKKNHIKIIDSGCFIGGTLSGFTKMFELKAKKGYYPVLFNTAANITWKGTLQEIDKSYFLYNKMLPDASDEFDDWYEENKEMYWDNKVKLIEYCDDDVTLLREGFQKFRTFVKKVTEKVTGDGKIVCVDPGSYTTSPSIAMAAWLSKHVYEDTIASLPVFLTNLLRPAARGGRTDLHAMYWKAKPGEMANYIDFTSLYPFVNRFGLYPKGHPTFTDLKETPITDEKEIDRILNSEGLGVLWVSYKCPQYLRHPVLPALRDGKLMFDLMDREHTEKDPVVHTSLELKHAVLRGYEVTKIHKICWWTQKIKGIFASYVDVMFKIKTEAEDLPTQDNSIEEINKLITDEVSKEYKEHMLKIDLHPLDLKEYMKKFWSGYEKCKIPNVTLVGNDKQKRKSKFALKELVKDDLKNLNIAKVRVKHMSHEEKIAYTKKFYDTLGITINIDNIKKNEGMRSVAKMFLNSLWGKMGEKLDYESHEILYDDKDSFIRHVQLDQRDEIKDFKHVADNCTVVIKEAQERALEDVLLKQNIAIAIFTTSQARLKLLTDFLEVADDRVLYYDTDSCIFFSRKDEDPSVLFPELGTELGMPTNELGTKKDQFTRVHITEFFSGGPKNYGYKLNTGQVKFRCKGIPNGYDVQAQMQYEECKNAVLKNHQIKVQIKGCIFRPKMFQLATEDRTKVYRNSYTKAKLLLDNDDEQYHWKTRPWGNADVEEYHALMKAIKKKPETSNKESKEHILPQKMCSISPVDHAKEWEKNLKRKITEKTNPSKKIKT